MIQATRTRDPLDVAAARRAPLTVGLLLTVVAWLVGRAAAGISWGAARNPFSFDPATWTRGDAYNYLSIAEHGSTYGPCPPAVQAFHTTLCGSAAWLPGVSWIVAEIHATGVSAPDAAQIVSWLAMAAALFVVWLGWGRDLPAPRALLVLVLFAVFPGCVYDFALFPMSLALACMVGSILAATKGRFFVMALLMAFAGLCYPSAWFAAAGLAVALTLGAIPLGPSAVLRRGLWGLAGLLSLPVLGLYDQLSVGHWNAYFLIQDQPANLPPGFPGEEFLRVVFRRDTGVQQRVGRFEGAVLAIQAVVAVALSAIAAVLAALGWRRREIDFAELYPVFVGGAVTLSLVLLSNPGAWDRSIALAGPIVLCLRRVSLPVLGVLVVVAALTTGVISHAFFAGP